MDQARSIAGYNSKPGFLKKTGNVSVTKPNMSILRLDRHQDSEESFASLGKTVYFQDDRYSRRTRLLILVGASSFLWTALITVFYIV